jgi:hypothetical protein
MVNLIIMKRIINQTVCLLGLVFLLVSCEYKEITDAQYPDQIIYMPAATAGIYIASDVSGTFKVPTSGGPARYYVDEAKSRIVVPLSVYRGGLTLKGGFSVDIKADADTVNQLIAKNTLINTELIAANKYTLAATVDVADGRDLAVFDLSIDLNLLKANLNKKFAIGVNISSRDRKSNDKLSTAIVVFDASVLQP